MPLYLDSAKIADAQKAAALSWVHGITTNPILLAESELTPKEALRQLADLIPGPVFYQLTSTNLEDMLREAEMAYGLLGHQLHLKIPPLPVGFEAAARLSKQIPCTITAVYSPAQAMVAQEAGARFVALYFHRTMSLIEGGMHLVREVMEVLQDTHTEILAASIKSPGEAILLRQAGIRHLTLPLYVLEAMTSHELSDQTAFDFEKRGVGLVLA